jgi:hypothetical protein
MAVFKKFVHLIKKGIDVFGGQEYKCTPVARGARATSADRLPSEFGSLKQ